MSEAAPLVQAIDSHVVQLHFVALLTCNIMQETSQEYGCTSLCVCVYKFGLLPGVWMLNI